MADPWELILYHTYTGTPGVIYDQSPARGSHGVAINLPDGDFLTDGVSPGSGAVNFAPDSMIRVPAAAKSWSPLGGLRAEVICIRDASTGVDTMVDGGSFRFYLRGGAFGAWFSAAPYQYAEIVSTFDGIDPTFTVPTGQWMTLGFSHDGASTMELSCNGTTVARARKPLWPVNSTSSVTIGNINTAGVTGMPGMSGRIDDVKIWRINPHRVSDEFTARPVDGSVKQCWAQWSQALAAVLEENHDCSVHLRALLMRAVAGIIRDGLNHNTQTRENWEKASQSYRLLWSHGDLGDLVPLLADLISYLQLVGLDPAQNADVVTLLNDACVQSILEKVPPIDCDPQFSHMLRDLAHTVERRQRSQHLTTGQDRAE